MTKGAPDYSKMVLLQALDDSGNLIPVLLDASGKIIAVLQGNDAGTLRTIKVDSTGQLYTLIKGSGNEDIAVDASGNLSAAMKGIDGVTLRTVAVDGSGNIIGILKGDYQGTLKTVATDADGRMLAKIYDPQDLFGANTVIGLSELAARLGSPMIFDRRGQIVWYDDFEAAVLKWVVNFGGTGSSVALDTTKAYRKEQSIKLTAGSDGAMVAYITKQIPFAAQRKMGLEVTVATNVSAPPGTLEFILMQSTTASRRTAKLEWDYTNAVLRVWNSSGAYQTIVTPFGYLGDALTWFTFKFVIDFSTGYYQRVMYGDQLFDASAIQCQSAGGSYDPSLIIQIKNTGAAGTNRISWVDDVIITTNEP